jgi:ABC-type multidrug transport system fused ATPase/permease subunit
MTAVAVDPQHGELARHALRELVLTTPEKPNRLSADALALARRALAEQHRPAVSLPGDDKDSASRATGGKSPGARPLDEGPGGGPRLADSIRMLGTAIRYQPGIFAVATAGAVAFCLMPVMVVVLIHLTVDRLWLPAIRTGHFDSSVAWRVAAGCFVVFGVRAAGLFAGRVAGMVMRLRLQDSDQRWLVDKYVEATVDWHDHHHPRDLVTTAERSVENSWRPVASLPFAVGGAVSLLAAIGVLGYLSWWLALIGLAVLAALLGLSIVFLRSAGPLADRARGLRRDVFERTDRASAPPDSSATGGSPPDPQAAFGRVSADFRNVLIRLRRRRGLFVPLFGGLPTGAMLVAVAVAGLTPLSGGGVDMVSAMVLFALLPAPVLAIGSVVLDMPNGVRGRDRVRELAAEAAGPAADGGRRAGLDRRDVPMSATVPSTAFPPFRECPRLNQLADGSVCVSPRRRAEPDDHGDRGRRRWSRSHRPGATAEKEGIVR